MGRMCISPVGLSAMTKLAPGKMVSLMLGVWFLSISMGSYFGGFVAGNFEPNESTLVGLFVKWPSYCSAAASCCLHYCR